MSIVILNVAAKKKGKTTLTKGYLNNHNGAKFIYDVNAEYKEFGSGAVFPKWKDFLEQAAKKTDTAIVFEEAFIFLKHQAQEEHMKELLVRTRHTRNLIILNFHAIHQIPMWVMDFVNYFVVGKTNDRPKWMLTNYRETDIYDAWNEAQISEDVFEKITLQLN